MIEERKMRRMKKIVWLQFVLVGLLLTGLVPRSSIVNVSATQFTGLDGPHYVAIGDYNNDGLNDLAIAEKRAGKVTVYKSDGTIIKQWTGITNPHGVAIGDYDNDGLNDLAFSQELSPGNVTVYKSDGTTIIKQWTVSYPKGVAIGDYDNDGLNELAFSNGGLPGNVTVYKSDGTTIVKQWTGIFWDARGVAIGDYDNDGLNELAFTEDNRPNLGKVIVYKNDGVTVVKQWTGLGYAAGVAIGDYDNDGLNELAFTDCFARLAVYKSDGTTIVKQLTSLIYPFGVAIGDYNNDGLNDLAFAETEYPANRVTVYYQTKPGTVARVAEPTIITLRGTLTNATGYPIQSGSIKVTVKDSMGTQVWQDTFENVIDYGRYSIPLGAKTTLMLVKGQIYNAILEVDADSPTFISADVIFGDNDPAGDLIKFVAS
jgi:hypothetical protein